MLFCRRNLATLLVVLATLATSGTTSLADVHARGYYRSNGTYVQPHYRSDPDGNVGNNWSTDRNVNPYTGAIGTKRYPSHTGTSYSSYAEQRYIAPRKLENQYMTLPSKSYSRTQPASWDSDWTTGSIFE
jgi:hypothetical protein